MPRFQHDCAKCWYHGNMDWHNPLISYDVYTCEAAYPNSDRVSLILRHGDEGSQYLSMPIRMVDRGLPEPYASARKFILTLEGKAP